MRPGLPAAVMQDRPARRCLLGGANTGAAQKRCLSGKPACEGGLLAGDFFSAVISAVPAGCREAYGSMRVSVRDRRQGGDTGRRRGCGAGPAAIPRTRWVRGQNPPAGMATNAAGRRPEGNRRQAFTCCCLVMQQEPGSPCRGRRRQTGKRCGASFVTALTDFRCRMVAGGP